MTRYEFETHLRQRVVDSPGFREALKENPLETVQREWNLVAGGFTRLPPDLEVTVLEQSEKKLYVVIPSGAEAHSHKLDSLELDQIMGGQL